MGCFFKELPQAPDLLCHDQLVLYFLFVSFFFPQALQYFVFIYLFAASVKFKKKKKSSLKKFGLCTIFSLTQSLKGLNATADFLAALTMSNIFLTDKN